MKSILNKTHSPIRVPLPRGKVLHLGPHKTGQIADHAAEHPKLQELIEAGSLEIVDEGARSATSVRDESPVHASTHGVGPKTTVKKAGDR